jgi:hypothetical protein
MTGLTFVEAQNIPAVAWTDGVTRGIDWRLTFVNGPNTLVSSVGVGSSLTAGTKPSQVFSLDPTKAGILQIRPRWGGIPYEAQAIATGKFANANIVINIPTDASDDMVFTIAQKVRDNFPSGRTVYVELANEPWNWAFSPFSQFAQSGPVFLQNNPFLLTMYVYRSVQCRDIFKKVFGARSGEICGYLNCQMGDDASSYLNYAKQNNLIIDAIACAPYVNPDDTDANRAAFSALDDDQCIDVYVHDLLYRPTGIGAMIGRLKASVNAYNQATGGNCKILCYEGGVGRAVPMNAANTGYNQGQHRNLIYNPNFYWAEQSHYALLQTLGVADFHIYGIGLRFAPDGWGVYHHYAQQPGRGDGSDGKADNRLFRFGVKPATVNQDASCVSVRGQAWLDWNAGVK